MDYFVVGMRDNRDGSRFEFECEASSADEAEAIANDEHGYAIAVDIQMK